MGSVSRKSYTKALPKNAELILRDGVQFARWKDGKGKTRTAKTIISASGKTRISIKVKTLTAKFRDGQGIVREVATGCKDEVAANGVLKGLERRAELVKAGVLSTTEDAIADHQPIPLVVHFAAYLDSLRVKSASKTRINNMKSQFERLCRDCNFTYLADLNADSLIKWLKAQEQAGMSAATRNDYRGTLVVFCNWCIDGTSPRLASNPFKSVPKADVKSDPRRKRRAMTEDELERLLYVAARRPLDDAMTIRRGKRKGQKAAKLSEETIRRLEREGRERVLIYKTLVLTGLRKAELTSLTIGQLFLEGHLPFAELEAADEKNREGSSIPLRKDLAEDLKQWIADRQSEPRSTVKFQSHQAATGPSTPIFNVPDGLLRILDRDLKAAGIPKRDDRGRTLDVHALRHSFGTLLSKGGVAPRTAQAAMRHSSIDLTMNVYTDPRLLDIHAALDLLPSLPLNVADRPEQTTLRATGTEDLVRSQLAPVLARNDDFASDSPSSRGRLDAIKPLDTLAIPNDASAYAVNEKGPLTVRVSDPLNVGATGFEPATSTSRTSKQSFVSDTQQQLTILETAACPSAFLQLAESVQNPSSDAELSIVLQSWDCLPKAVRHLLASIAAANAQ